MKNLLFDIVNNKKKYKLHFVGVGGVSMSRLAMFCNSLGHKVTGSDMQKSENVIGLIKKGIKIEIGHKKENVVGADAVIFSYAVENAEEVKYAKSLNIPIFSRAELLGEILKTYKTSIAIAGAHGKTTTTALIYHILKNAGLNVDLHLGGKLVREDEEKENIKTIKKDIIVCEACEYKDAFLKLKPTIAVINNIAPEHLDYFKTFDNVKRSFNKFSKSARLLICNSLHTFENKNIIKFGENGEFFTKNIKMNKNGTYNFDCYKKNKLYGRFTINLIGRHNVYNALASIVVADSLNINKDVIKKSLANFMGVERRYQILDKNKFIVHDYAHHPEEIEAVIQETIKFYKGKLLVVFQPHTYTRTKTLMNEFTKCFKSLSDVVIYKTYSAREKYLKGGSAKTLAKNIGDNAKYFKNKTNLTNYVVSKIYSGYGVLLLGAGNIDIISKNIVKLC